MTRKLDKQTLPRRRGAIRAAPETPQERANRIFIAREFEQPELRPWQRDWGPGRTFTRLNPLPPSNEDRARLRAQSEADDATAAIERERREVPMRTGLGFIDEPQRFAVRASRVVSNFGPDGDETRRESLANTRRGWRELSETPGVIYRALQSAALERQANIPANAPANAPRRVSLRDQQMRVMGYDPALLPRDIDTGERAPPIGEPGSDEPMTPQRLWQSIPRFVDDAVGFRAGEAARETEINTNYAAARNRSPYADAETAQSEDEARFGSAMNSLWGLEFTGLPLAAAPLTRGGRRFLGGAAGLAAGASAGDAVFGDENTSGADEWAGPVLGLGGAALGWRVARAAAPRIPGLAARTGRQAAPGAPPAPAARPGAPLLSSAAIGAGGLGVAGEALAQSPDQTPQDLNQYSDQDLEALAQQQPSGDGNYSQFSDQELEQIAAQGEGLPGWAPWAAGAGAIAGTALAVRGLRGPINRAMLPRRLSSELSDHGVIDPAARRRVAALARSGASREDVAAALEQARNGRPAPSIDNTPALAETMGIDPAAITRETADRLGVRISSPQATNNLSERLAQDDILRVGGDAPERARRIIAGFNDEQAQSIQNARRVLVERELGATAAPGHAGATMAQDLRETFNLMQGNVDDAYAAARASAEATGPLPNNIGAALADDVGRMVRYEERLTHDPRVIPWTRSVEGLAADIASGQATWRDVEKVRQNISSAYGTAARGGDDDYARILAGFQQRIDNFIDQHAPRRAAGTRGPLLYGDLIREARRVRHELGQIFGDRLSGVLPDEAFRGPTRDIASRRLASVIGEDLPSGAIEGMLINPNGTISRPSVALARRIRDSHDRLIISDDYQAVTGSTAGARGGQVVRSPGRISLTNNTSGTQRFAADQASGRAQAMFPRMAAAREAVYDQIVGSHLTRRAAGEAVHARTMASAIRTALSPAKNGGRELMSLLFTPAELAEWERFAALLDNIAVPEGAARSGTPGGLRRMAAGFFRTLFAVPNALTGGLAGGLLNSIGQVAANSRYVRDARRFTAPPRLPRNGGRLPAIALAAGAGAGAAIAGADSAQAQERDEVVSAQANIARIEAELVLIEEASRNRSNRELVTRVQELLQGKGAYGGNYEPDGDWRRGTQAAVESVVPRLRAELERERGVLSNMRQDLAARNTRPSELQQALQTWGPNLGFLAGGYFAHSGLPIPRRIPGIGRLSGWGGRESAVREAGMEIAERNRAANLRLPTRGREVPRAASNAAARERMSRAANMNEFYQQGGAGDRVPFDISADNTGFTARPNSMPASRLYQPALPPGLREFGLNDIGAMATAGVESSYIENVLLPDARSRLEEAEDAAKSAPESVEKRQAVNEARENVARLEFFQRAGLGYISGRIIAPAFRHSRYPTTRPNVSRAESEVMELNRFLAPRPPRAPRKKPK